MGPFSQRRAGGLPWDHCVIPRRLAGMRLQSATLRDSSDGFEAVPRAKGIGAGLNPTGDTNALGPKLGKWWANPQTCDIS